MDVSEARKLVGQHHRAVLATQRADGQPQLSPVMAAVDDAGRVMISTRETAMKVKNLRHRPRAWLCVLTEHFFGDWAQVEGELEIVALPDAMELLVDYYRRISGDHPDWDEYRQAMRDEHRVMLLMKIDRAGPTRSG